MKNFTVLYRDETLGENSPPYKFECQADDLSHAQEQCLNANEGCRIVPTKYLVPAFFIVEADDADHATEVAGEIASDVNSTLRAAADNDCHLLLDLEAMNVEVADDPSGELPHTTPAAQACIALTTAYAAGEESSSVDWSDIDSAYELAKRAVERPERPEKIDDETPKE